MPKSPAKKRVKRTAAATAAATSKNGRVLTAKQLPERTYQTIHRLPHGCRQDVLKALLGAAAAFAAERGPGWQLGLLEGRVKLTSA